MKKWIVIDNADETKYVVIGSSVRPKHAICEAPKYKGDYITNIDDIIIEEIYEDKIIVEVKARHNIVKIKKKLKKDKKDKKVKNG